MGRYVRARLKRRIFAWFLGGLLTTGVLVATVMVLVGRVEEPHWRFYENVQGWVGRQFERDWDDPVARERFARQTAVDFAGAIELLDARGEPLSRDGVPCRHPIFEFPVTRAGVSLGSGRLCVPHSPAAGWRWGLVIGLGVFAVWAASGRVAARLARPLDELTEVVTKIGAGDLKARAQLSCAQPDEIGVVAEAVNEMAARIEKQVIDQRELLATVSHEMRTPLARLRIISEIAREAGSTNKTFDDLDREVMEMDALVGQLLASSRVEFGQVAPRRLSLRDLCTEAVERAGLSPELLRIDGTSDALDADPTLLHRALANLFDNAKKHAGGVEALEVTSDGATVRFEVLDRGPGISGDADALFRKFTRGERGSDTGLGLGLALVKRIAEAHRGSVFARNREGGGAVFGLELSA
jgi:signal transduction histidine kinase